MRKEYYEKNKVALLKKSKEYRERNKDRLYEYAKAWRKKNQARVNELRKARYEKYYKAKNNELSRQWHIRYKAWFEDLKSTLKCEYCGEAESVCLDFHHINPNEKDRSVNGMKNRHSKAKLLIEISKCVVLCCNCHRKLHQRLRETNHSGDIA